MLEFIKNHLKKILIIQIISSILLIIFSLLIVFFFQYKNYLFGFLVLPTSIFNVLIYLYFIFQAIVKKEKWKFILIIFPSMFILVFTITVILLFLDIERINHVGFLMSFLINLLNLFYIGLAFNKNQNEFGETNAAN